nr:hypothetical protein [Tanacetum cinerariifolium]
MATLKSLIISLNLVVGNHGGGECGGEQDDYFSITIIVAGAENLPPVLEKSMYDSWASRIRLFIKEKKHCRMMLDSIDNGPLVYPTVEENGQIRPKKYFELTEAQQLQDDCDVQATNIILHGLPPDVYTLINHQEASNDIWEKSKFVTEVKLAKSAYTTNYDQLYAYLSQHECHANEVRIMRERYLDPLALVANSPTLYNPSQSPQHSGSSIFLFFDMIRKSFFKCILLKSQHAVIFVIDDNETLILEEKSRSKLLDKQNDLISMEKKIKISPIDYSKLNNIKEDFGKRFVTHKEFSIEQAFWLKHSSFPEIPVTSHTHVRIKAPSELPKSKFVTEVKLAKSAYTTNYDQLYAYLSQHECHANEVRIMRERYLDPLALVANSPTLYNPSQSPQHSGSSIGIATTARGNYAAGEKLMLAEEQEAGQILDEEQLTFLADPRISEALVGQQTIPQNSAFQIEYLDTYDSDCDDLSSTKVVLMANLLSCDSDVLSEV